MSRKAPTKAEALRIMESKLGPCLACQVRADSGMMDWNNVVFGCDYHHTKSGNLRRGHAAGFALCVWHHRGQPLIGESARMTRAIYGPSLMDGGKLFREAYGTDDELIELQTKMLKGPTW